MKPRDLLDILIYILIGLLFTLGIMAYTAVCAPYWFRLKIGMDIPLICFGVVR